MSRSAPVGLAVTALAAASSVIVVGLWAPAQEQPCPGVPSTPPVSTTPTTVSTTPTGLSTTGQATYMIRLLSIIADSVERAVGAAPSDAAAGSAAVSTEPTRTSSSPAATSDCGSAGTPSPGGPR